jgi:hypothetical protein
LKFKTILSILFILSVMTIAGCTNSSSTSDSATVNPTIAPTQAPTIAPTSKPTVAPTPTENPKTHAYDMMMYSLGVVDDDVDKFNDCVAAAPSASMPNSFKVWLKGDMYDAVFNLDLDNLVFQSYCDDYKALPDVSSSDRQTVIDSAEKVDAVVKDLVSSYNDVVDSYNRNYGSQYGTVDTYSL